MSPESEKTGFEAVSPGGDAASEVSSGLDSDGARVVDADGGDGRQTGGPWAIAWRRLRRNKFALFALGVFFLILICCLLAPVWANHVAHTGPNTTHTLEKLHEGGEVKEVVEPSGKAIGPQWFSAGGKFFLGADGHLGRDEMVRLLYGGRASLFIGIVAAIITTVLAVIFGLLAGFYGGFTDTVISRVMDVIWAFPVVLLAIALGIVLAVGGLEIGPIHLKSSSLWIPTLIIGFVYTPYMARPLRGEVLALREKEFIEAAVAQGAGPLRIMFVELLPNLISTIIVFFTLNIANNMLLEAVALLPRCRRPAAELLLGDDDLRRLRSALQPAAADDHPGHRDPAHGALGEHLRRRPARRARPEIESPLRGARRAPPTPSAMGPV